MLDKLDSWPAVIGLTTVGGVLVYGFGWHVAWILPLSIIGVVCGIIVFQACSFFLRDPEKRWRRLRILETNYGRGAGWFVELDGRRVAVLTAPEFVDMFWESYHIEPMTENAGERHRILTDHEWWLEDKLIYRNQELGDVAEFAFASGLTESGRIVMRGLYLNVDEANLWEKIYLFLRRKRSEQKG